MARPTSRVTERILSWWNVAICPDAVDPYLSTTYRMTSSRRFLQKSTSKSGMDTRWGLRNRSNSRLY